MKPVIFLDFDGVLNRIGSVEDGRTLREYGGIIALEPELVERMNELQRRTDAFVVCSSDWRKEPTWREDAKANGLTFDFLDRTPRLRGFRGHEIHAWLKKNRDLKNYAIIDDDSDMLALQKPHFFKTSSSFGLTQEIADKVAEHICPK